MAELAALIPFLSAIGTVKNVIAYGFQLKGTSESARNAKQILERVQRDINTLRRLAWQRWGDLSNTERHEVQRAILDANEAIIKIAEPVKYSAQNVVKYGTVTLYRRILWTIRDGDTVNANMNLIQICHRSIHGQITIMSNRRYDSQASLVNENNSVDTLPEGVCLKEKRIRHGMLKKKALWDAFADGSLRTNNSPSVSTADDDEERRDELRPGESAGHGPYLTVPGVGDENALLGIGGASHLSSGVHDHHQDDFHDGVWEEYSARRSADTHRRSKSVDKSPSPLDDLYAEFNARSEEDLWRRNRMQTSRT